MKQRPNQLVPIGETIACGESLRSKQRRHGAACSRGRASLSVVVLALSLPWLVVAPAKYVWSDPLGAH